MDQLSKVLKCRPAFEAQNPSEKPDVVVHTCNPHIGEAESGAHWPANLAYLVSPKPMKNKPVHQKSR